MQQKHPVIPHDLGDCRTRFAIGRFIWQFVIVSKHLAVVARPHTACNIHFPRNHVGPQPVDRFDIRPVTRQGGHVGHGAVHVARAHRVPDGLRLLCHGRVILAFGGILAEHAPIFAAAFVQKELCERQKLSFARCAKQLHQPELNLLVARNIPNAVHAESRRNQVGVSQCHVEKRALARGLKMRHRGFVHVPHIVQLVTRDEKGPSARARPLVVHVWMNGSQGVEISVVFLGGGHLFNQGIQMGIEFGILVKAKGIRRALHDLEYV